MKTINEYNDKEFLLHLIRGSRVQLEPAAYDLPDLALFTTIGCNLHKQQEEESTVAAIVPVIVLYSFEIHTYITTSTWFKWVTFFRQLRHPIMSFLACVTLCLCHPE